MSVAGSLHKLRGGRGRHSHGTTADQVSEADIPAGFKTGGSNVSGRRHRGFVRSEVKKTAATFLSNTTKDREFQHRSNVGLSSQRGDDIDGDLDRALQSSGLPDPVHIDMRSEIRRNSIEGITKAFSQPSLARLAAMDAFRAEMGNNNAKAETKSPQSDTTSLDITVDSVAGCQASTDRQKSCWARGDEAAEDAAPTWDNTGHDVEKYGPLHPPISLNNLPRRLPRTDTLANASTPTESSFNRRLARGANTHKNVNLSPTLVVNLNRLQRTDTNFPSLHSSQKQYQTKKAERILNIPVYESFAPKNLSTSTSTTNQAGKKPTVANFQSTSTDTLSASEAQIKGEPDISIERMDNISADPEATIAPHLRPKPDAIKNRANPKTHDAIPLRSRQTLETPNTHSGKGVKPLPIYLPPHLARAWHNSGLTSTGEDKDNGSSIQQPDLVREASVDSEAISLTPAEVVPKVGRGETPQPDLLIGSDKTSPGTSPAPSKERHESSSQKILKVMATEHTELAKSHTACPPKTDLHPRKAEKTSVPMQESVPITPDPPAAKLYTLFQDSNKFNINNGEPPVGSSALRKSAPKIAYATSNQRNGLSGHVSATARAMKLKDASSKTDIGPFPWISGTEHNGLQGWDNKLKPAPIGEEWAMRDAHDVTDAKHKASIETWASDQYMDQAGKSVEIDVNSPEFLTGQGIIDDDMGMQQGIEASLHDAIPDRTTLNEPKRQLNTEDIIKDHMSRPGFPPSQTLPKKQEKRDPISGETKAERRARLEFARAAERSVNLEPNEHTPEANIYMRPAEPKDIPLITDLHNGFVTNSTATHFVKPSDESLWRETLEARAMQVKDVRRGKFESVVGFAYGADFGAPDNAYRITLEIEIWVDPRHQRQGIGKTLLDRMLACLDPMYAWKDPAPFLDMGKTMKWMGGGHRIIQTLIVSLLYPNHEKEALEWKKAWLERSGFQSGGVIPNIARKSRKQINLCQMYYTTGHDVSHIFQ